MAQALTTQLGVLRIRLSALSQQVNRQDLSEEDCIALDARCKAIESTVDTMAEESQQVKPDSIQDTQWQAIKTFASQLFQSTQDSSFPKRTNVEYQMTIEGLINPLIDILSERVLGSHDSTLNESTVIGYEDEYGESKLAYYINTSPNREVNKTIWDGFRDTYIDFILILRQELKFMSDVDLYPREIQSLLKERSPQIFNKERLIGLALLICLFDTNPSDEQRLKIRNTLTQLSSISSIEQDRFLDITKEIQSSYEHRPAAFKDLVTDYIQGEEIPSVDKLNMLIASLDFNHEESIFSPRKTVAEDNIFLFSLFFRDIQATLKPPEEKRRKILAALDAALDNLETSIALYGRVTPLFPLSADQDDMPLHEEDELIRSVGASLQALSIGDAELHGSDAEEAAASGRALQVEVEEPADYAHFAEEAAASGRASSPHLQAAALINVDVEDRDHAIPPALTLDDLAAPASSRFSSRSTSPSSGEEIEDLSLAARGHDALSEGEIREEAAMTDEAQAVLHRLIALYMTDFKRDFFQQCHRLPDHPQGFLIIRTLMVCFCDGNAFDEALSVVKESQLSSDDKGNLLSYIAQYLFMAPWLLNQLNEVLELIESRELKQGLIVNYLQNIPSHMNALLFEEDEHGTNQINDFQIDQLARFLSIAAEESSYEKKQLNYREDLETHLSQTVNLLFIRIMVDRSLDMAAKETLLSKVFMSCLTIFCDTRRIESFKSLLTFTRSPDKRSRLLQEFAALDISYLALAFNSMREADLDRALFVERDNLLANTLNALIEAGQFSKAYQLIRKLSPVAQKTRSFNYAVTILYRIHRNPKAASQFLGAAKKPDDFPPTFRSGRDPLSERLAHSDYHTLMYAWVQFLLNENHSLYEALETPPDLFEEATFASLQFFNTFFTTRDLSAEELRLSAIPLGRHSLAFENCSWLELYTLIHGEISFKRWDEQESLFSPDKDLLLSGHITSWVEKQHLEPLQKNTLYYHIIHYLIVSGRMPTSFYFHGLDDLMDKITDESVKINLERTLSTYFEWNIQAKPNETVPVFMNHLAFVASQRQDKKIHGEQVENYFSMGRHRFSGTCDLAISILTYFADHGKKSYHDLPHEYRVALPFLRPHLEGEMRTYWKEPSVSRR